MQVIHFILFCYILPFFKSSFAIDTISLNQTLRDNGETLVSSEEKFELGFFSPLNSTNRYIGIWYNNIPQQTVVWVANRNNPLTNSSGVLTITSNGNIVIFNNQTGTSIWSSNSSTTSNNPILQLLNTGNLVVKDGNINDDTSNHIWQSFDYPCNTLIPGMKVGWDGNTGKEVYLTTWKNDQDPSIGDFKYVLDHHGLPQMVLMKGSIIRNRIAPWYSLQFGSGPILTKPPGILKPNYIYETNNISFSFENFDDSIISRLEVNESGFIKHSTWNQPRGKWFDTYAFPRDPCDYYKQCGPNGICNEYKSPGCRCPAGFVPKDQQEWDLMHWSGGCVRKISLNCSVTGEGFKKFSRLKLPDNSYILANRTEMSREECEEACLRNCTCLAYAITELSDCVVWFNDVVDIKEYEEGHELYIRMSASELERNYNNKLRAALIWASILLGVLLLASIGLYVIRKRKITRRIAQRLNKPCQVFDLNVGEEDLELLLFDFGTIEIATDNFSFANKIGQGGFGSVYKGELSTGQGIAVKRLSKDSGQGIKEFKNEVILIAKLQHRNLVRLLGCCIHGEEQLLIYEYMPNGSLDFYIFNKTRDISLDWQKHFDIIAGIARGLLYLHRDSRLRIIHRDLKASNILLDGHMNPKISDFGMAKTFGGDQYEANTNRIMGTYGYMSPEYVIDGHFSVKSDVFSFGVLVLEIVSGRKNRDFYHPDHDLNLLGHAWKLWNEGRAMELMDVSLENTITASEVLRSIQVGLLCVQQRPEDRPTMSTVLLMLDSENPLLPQPKKPGFYTGRYLIDNISSPRKKLFSVNEVTITMLQAR